MKGVSVRLGHRKEKEDKDKDKKADKDKTKDDDKDNIIDEEDEDEDEDEDDSRGSASPAPFASSSKSHGGKGWSAMLDGMSLLLPSRSVLMPDWFCGPPKEAEATRILSQTGRDTPSSIPSTPVTGFGNPFLAAPLPPPMVRASSAPGSISPSSSPRARTVSPLNHSIIATDSPDFNSSDEDRPSVPMPRVASSKTLQVKTSTNSLRKDATLPASKETKEGRDNKEKDGPAPSKDREGCYVHLVKERLMGIFFSVYVYKGCEQLVEGEWLV